MYPSLAAASYAAANEGYMYGNQHNPNHNSSHSGQSQSTPWANQAAAYMAEAGMPFVDQNYSARPINSTSGFGQFSKSNTTSSASHRDLTEAGRRAADISGFENFGPGTIGGQRRSEDGHGYPHDGELHRSITPPVSETESDFYANELGSPNGIMSSSFTANLLPQGLLGSLEGDVTPMEDGDQDVFSSTLQEALEYDPPTEDKVVDHDSGSESASEEDVYRSPVAESKVENGHKRLGGGISRFLPSKSASPGAKPISPANLPMFHPPSGPRRWFSGTGSSDNVNSFNFIHPIGTASNDSLSNLGPGYDASPFAPSDSEKKALKWGPLSKYRWAGNRPATSIKDIEEPTGENEGEQLSPNRFHFGGDLFRAPSQPVARSSSINAGTTFGSNWLSARHTASHDKSGAVDNGNEQGNGNGHGHEVDQGKMELEEGEEEKAQDKKAAFRFFSLRKPSSSNWSSS